MRARAHEKKMTTPHHTGQVHIPETRGQGLKGGAVRVAGAVRRRLA